MQIVPPKKVLKATLIDVAIQNPTVRSSQSSEYLVEDCIGASTFHLVEDEPTSTYRVMKDEACSPPSLQAPLS